VALTGRAALAAAAGALLILAFRAPAMLIVVNALLVAAIAADLALAAPVHAIRLSRSGDTRVLLGERASVELGVENPSRRTLRAVIRDAWQPSAGAAPPQARVTVPAGGRARGQGSGLIPVAVAAERAGQRPLAGGPVQPQRQLTAGPGDHQVGDLVDVLRLSPARPDRGEIRSPGFGERHGVERRNVVPLALVAHCLQLGVEGHGLHTLSLGPAEPAAPHEPGRPITSYSSRPAEDRLAFTGMPVLGLAFTRMPVLGMVSRSWPRCGHVTEAGCPDPWSS